MARHGSYPPRGEIPRQGHDTFKNRGTFGFVLRADGFQSLVSGSVGKTFSDRADGFLSLDVHVSSQTGKAITTPNGFVDLR